MYSTEPNAIRAALSKPNEGDVLYGYHLLKYLVEDAYHSCPAEPNVSELKARLSELDRKDHHYAIVTTYDPNTSRYRSTIDVKKFNSVGEEVIVGNLQVNFSITISDGSFRLTSVSDVVCKTES